MDSGNYGNLMLSHSTPSCKVTNWHTEHLDPLGPRVWIIKAIKQCLLLGVDSLFVTNDKVFVMDWYLKGRAAKSFFEVLYSDPLCVMEIP